MNTAKISRFALTLLITIFSVVTFAAEEKGAAPSDKSKSFEDAPAAVQECLKSLQVDLKNADASKEVSVETLKDESVLCYVRSSQKDNGAESKLTITKGPLVFFKDETFNVNVAKDKQTVSLSVDSIDEKKSAGLHSLKYKKEIVLKKCDIQQWWSDQCLDLEAVKVIKQVKALQKENPKSEERISKFISMISPQNFTGNVCQSYLDTHKEKFFRASLLTAGEDRNDVYFVLMCNNGKLLENLTDFGSKQLQEINCKHRNVPTHQGEPHNPLVYFDLESCQHTMPKPKFEYTQKKYKEISFEKNGFKIKGTFEKPVEGYFKWGTTIHELESEKGWRLSFYSETYQRVPLKDGLHITYQLTERQIAELKKNPKLEPSIWFVSGYDDLVNYGIAPLLNTKFDRKNFQLEVVDRKNNPLDGYQSIDDTAYGNIIYVIRLGNETNLPGAD